MSGLVTLEIDDAGIAWVRMVDRTGRNCFHDRFVDELLRALEDAAAEPRARVCVLTGLPDVWSGGGARRVLEELVTGARSPYDLTLTRALLDMPLPTIAAMEGAAVGGGFVLGFACDIVVLSEAARYGCNFVDYGFTPGMGATRILELALGAPLAAEMLFGAACLRGDHFRGRSLINYIEPQAEVVRRAQSVAMRMTDKPRHVLELLKRALNSGKRRAFEEAREVEALMHTICFARGDAAAALRDNYPDSHASHDSHDNPRKNDDARP